jgi:LuxR family transcriptional regulator, maltose regulon positive regulatory protein
MHRPDQLIRTKLRPPFTRSALVPRPRLLAQVAAGLCGPLTLITAPAGFGKTTLASACLASCGMPVAWLSLDKNDNQEGVFLRYLVAALQAAGESLGAQAAQLLASPQPALPQAVLTSLVNDLDACTGEIVLALDDYQFIHAAPVHDALAFLIEHCPPNLHLLIATRSDPPLPLARLRARGQTVELRLADLRFTASESAQFLNGVMGLTLAEGDSAALTERTEGWIAGLQMASIALQSHLALTGQADASRFIQAFSGANRYILDYLLEEVLTSQPQEIQRFLLFTSILERISAPLCAALLEDLPDPAAALDHLERANLFLFPLDDERQWYRYHHLFADLLRLRLSQAYPEQVPLLHLRASAWLEQNGLIPEAVQHAFAAGEAGLAADLIDRWGSVWWAQNDLTVIQMADSLPGEILLERPKTAVCQAWRLVTLGQIRDAFPLLTALRQQFENATSPGTAWLDAVVRLALAFLAAQNSPARFAPLPAPEILDQIPPEEEVLHDAAEILYGMTLGRRGLPDQAAEFSQRCLERTPVRAGTLVIPTMAAFLARVYIMLGRLHAAAALARTWLDPIREKGVWLAMNAGSLDIVLGEALFEWGCLDEADQHIRIGLSANLPWQNIMTQSFGMINLTRLLIAQGDYAGAHQSLDELEVWVKARACPREFDEDYLTLRARIHLASGDLPAAAQWADEFAQSEACRTQPHLYRLTLARIRLAQGHFEQVLKLLAAPQPPEAVNRTARQIREDITRAAALSALGRQVESLDLVDASLTLAEPEGYLYSFISLGEPARLLLSAYMRQETALHKPYARQLLDIFAGARPPALPQGSELVEPLSARELEVLQLLAQGLTNPEIARRLVVAAGTVKAHTASIYRKLDAPNRTAAVARARALGLLA